MAIEGLSIIGEKINDSVPSTQKLFAAGDIEGIKALAKEQEDGGATYIDVNVGTRDADFMASMVKEVQAVTAKPLSIDSPDPALVEAALKVYDRERAGGGIPVLNSIALSRTEMFDLYTICPFKPLYLLSESDSGPNRTAGQAYETAKRLKAMGKEKCGIENGDCIFDPGIAPIGSDTEGINKMVVGSMEKMHNDPDFTGVHMSVGLSNFTVMIPSKKADGSPVKSPLESAFLTIAMPLGLDHVIGNVKRNYQKLDDGDPALECVKDVLFKLDGMDAILRVTEYYS